jgi:hypothetical protein
MPGSLELRYAEIKDPVSKLGGRKLACGFIGSEVRSFDPRYEVSYRSKE